MNEALAQLYFKLLCSGDIKYTAKRAFFSARPDFSEILSLEEAVYGRRILNDTTTRKLPEFKRAVELYESPLMEAMK